MAPFQPASARRYAALCQEADIVPMVEPEVLIDGDHTIERCYAVSLATLRAVFNQLAEHRVAFEGTGGLAGDSYRVGLRRLNGNSSVFDVYSNNHPYQLRGYER